MNLSRFLQLIRWQNIVLVWLMQIIVFYLYVKPACGANTYTYDIFIVFILAIGCSIGAGNLLNDIVDQESDKLNPKRISIVGEWVSEQLAWRYYYILLSLSALLAIVGIFIGWPTLLLDYFIVINILLYFYSTKWQNSVLYGNITIAFLGSSGIWIVSVLLPNCNIASQIDFQDKTSIIIWGYTLMAFFIHLIREIIKDLEDRTFDMEVGVYTLASKPIAMVKTITNSLIVLLTAIIMGQLFLLAPYINSQQMTIGLAILLIPLVIITIIFNNPVRSNTYSFLSKLIKVYIIFSLLLLILWQK